MRLTLLSTVLILFCTVELAVQQTEKVLQHFKEFQKRHERKYKSSGEKEKRLAHFQNNHKRIEELNAEARKAGRNVTFGVNKFADKSQAEFHARLSRAQPKNHSDLPIYKPRHPRHQKRTKRENTEVPNHFDLRDVNVDGNPIIGPVKDQEECGCCWAFAATAITETANALYSKQYSSLSDQEICDCADSDGTPGCVGGDPRNGLQFVSRHGQTNDYVYPYEEFRANTTGNCDYEGKEYVIKPRSMQVYRFEENYAESDIIENLYFNHIPTAVYFRVGEKFEWYNSGILQSEDCNKMNPAVWHSAAIIGYGSGYNDDSDEKIDYWIVRNSWDTDWGEDGYVRIKRGIDWCEIESHPATAMIQGTSGQSTSSSSSSEEGY